MSLRMASMPSSFFSTLTCAEATTVTPPPRPPRNEGTANGTPAARLLLARLADADRAAVGVARHNDLVAHEDQLLVAVEAGRVVRGGSVPVGLAGWGGHRPQRWRGGCPLCCECVGDFSRRRAASLGCRRRVTTQRPRCAKARKRVLRKFESYALDDGRQPWASAGPNKSTVGRREADELIYSRAGLPL